jgi:hypothetical protein
VKIPCICCNKPARDPHHPWPKSQGGADKGEVPACRDCHSLYHAICGQQLAKTVKARVRNFGVWMSKFPQHDMMGHSPGINPAAMAPMFVREEAGHFLLTQEYEDFSEGCLSTLGKVTTYPPRKTVGGTRRI